KTAHLTGLLHLGGETAPHVGIPRPVGVQHLDRRPGTVLGLAEEHLTEPTTAQGPKKSVPTDRSGARVLCLGVVHSPPVFRRSRLLCRFHPFRGWKHCVSASQTTVARCTESVRMFGFDDRLIIGPGSRDHHAESVRRGPHGGYRTRWRTRRFRPWALHSKQPPARRGDRAAR